MHTIAIQVPISPTSPAAATADQRDATRARSSACGPRPAGRRSRVTTTTASRQHGPYAQVSRLGNPLFNEVIVPDGAEGPVEPPAADDDKQFAEVRRQARAGRLLPVLYPGVFPNLAALHEAARRPGGDPADRHPDGHRPGFQNYTGRSRPTCCGSTWRSADRRASRARSGCSAATRPASRTGAGSSTTWSRSSCGPSPGPPSRWSTRPSRRTPPPRCSPTARRTRTRRTCPAFPYSGTPAGGYQTTPGTPAV